MSVMFSANGEIPVKDVPEVQKIVDQFNDISSDIRADFDGQTVMIEGSSYMGYGSASDLELLIKDLSPFATAPSFIYTEMDDEPCRLYVGPPEGEAAACSKDALKEIKELLSYLTLEDKAVLKNLL